MKAEDFQPHTVTHQGYEIWAKQAHAAVVESDRCHHRFFRTLEELLTLQVRHAVSVQGAGTRPSCGFITPSVAEKDARRSSK